MAAPMATNSATCSVNSEAAVEAHACGLFIIGSSVLDAPDFGQFFLQGKLVQFLDGQAHEKLDAARQLVRGLPERRAPGFVALDVRRVGYAPVRGGGMPQPDRAGFACRVIAHGEDEIE